jgi:uncharacterized membrane protein YphA (DoxX/SURF4 family)
MSHFFYTAATAQMIPAWIPAHLVFAYLTGAGHLAAGIALLTGMVPRLAATCEALMLGAFVLLLHVPLVAASPHERINWTMLAVALAFDGGIWLVASAL